MQHPRLPSCALALTLTLLSACKRGDGSSTAGAAKPGVAPTVQAAAAPVAAPAPRPAPRPALDPRWPQWLPPVAGVTVRIASRDFLEGYAGRPDLMVLVDSRRACEAAGFTVSQTTMRRTQWENRFIFTATRGE